MNTQPQQPNKSFKDTLLKKIEADKVCPRSNFSFMCQECFVWFLWAMSVAVGALAVSVSLFVITHSQYALYEATHDNLFTYMAQVLPYLWIIIFGLMVYVAVYNIHHTKRGYRYPISIIILSSIVLSFAGGSALQFFGFGYDIDDMLGKNMPMYISQAKLEGRMWQAPSEGRLLGMQVFSTLSPTTTIVFEDMSGQRWRMDISELQTREMELLALKKKVRLIGKEQNGEFYIFHACGVFPWMVDKGVTMHDMDVERRAFLERVNSHAARDQEKNREFESDVSTSTILSNESPCAKITPVKRMPMEKIRN